MGRLQGIFNKIKRRLRGRASRPQDIPNTLDPQTLEKAMREARFLQGSHGVDVRSLQPGEIPMPPHRAD